MCFIAADRCVCRDAAPIRYIRVILFCFFLRLTRARSYIINYYRLFLSRETIADEKFGSGTAYETTAHKMAQRDGGGDVEYITVPKVGSSGMVTDG